MSLLRSSPKSAYRIWVGLAEGLIAVSVAVLPLALVWLGCRLFFGERILSVLMCCTLIAASPAILWVFWVALLLGKPHPRIAAYPFVGPMLIRMQLSFIDGIEAIRTPADAARNRKAVLETSKRKVDPGSRLPD